MATRIVIPILLLAALFSGPALQVLAASDWNVGRWPSRWSYALQLLSSYPFGFFLVSLVAYSVAIKPPQTIADLSRLLAAGFCAFALQAVLFFVSLPLMFAIGDGSLRQMVVVGLCIIGALHASIVGTFHHFILQSGVPARFEIPAHILCAALPVWFLDLYAPGIGVAPKFHLFGGWPALLALIPYAALIAIYVPRSTRYMTAALAVGLAATPPYAVKAICDYHSPREEPLTWPHRVLTKFDNTFRRSAAWGQFQKKIIYGPFNLGQGWYRLKSANQFHQAFTEDMTPTTPLHQLKLTVPMSFFEVSQKPDSAPFMMLTMKLALDRGRQNTPDTNTVVVPYRDLTLTLDYSGAIVQPSQLEGLHSKIVEFADNLRVQAPAQ